MISDNYLNVDSVDIRITYTLIPSCIEQHKGQLNIRSTAKESGALYFPHDGGHEVIKPIKGSVINEVRRFEKIGKNTESCGGYAGGNGMVIEMIIGQDSTSFAYCKDNWNGLRELLEALKEKTTTNNGS